MKAPVQCVLWKTPELIRDPSFMSSDPFEGLETFEEDEHFRRFLFKCRECGQLYIYDFYEEINWSGGDDTQIVTYIPVETDEEIKMLKDAWVPEIMQVFPRLVKDLSTGTAAWVLKR